MCNQIFYNLYWTTSEMGKVHKQDYIATLLFNKAIPSGNFVFGPGQVQKYTAYICTV